MFSYQMLEDIHRLQLMQCLSYPKYFPTKFHRALVELASKAQITI